MHSRIPPFSIKLKFNRKTKLRVRRGKKHTKKQTHSEATLCTLQATILVVTELGDGSVGSHEHKKRETKFTFESRGGKCSTAKLISATCTFTEPNGVLEMRLVKQRYSDRHSHYIRMESKMSKWQSGWVEVKEVMMKSRAPTHESRNNKHNILISRADFFNFPLKNQPTNMCI